MNETLEIGQVHPAAHSAMRYITEFLATDVGKSMIVLESFASTALSDNQLSAVCYGTLKRIINNEPVSDRYLLGLAWTLKEMAEHETRETDRNDDTQSD